MFWDETQSVTKVFLGGLNARRDGFWEERCGKDRPKTVGEREDRPGIEKKMKDRKKGCEKEVVPSFAGLYLWT